MSDLIDTWHINNRINLYLLDTLAEEQLNDLAASKGRTVGEQLAHLHNVRLMWLKAAQPDLLIHLNKLEKGSLLTKALLAAQLTKSGEAIAKLLETGASSGKIKGFKPHPTAFLGYLLAHEAHHRGQLILALKQSGHPIDQKTMYGLWEWGIR